MEKPREGDALEFIERTRPEDGAGRGQMEEMDLDIFQLCGTARQTARLIHSSHTAVSIAVSPLDVGTASRCKTLK